MFNGSGCSVGRGSYAGEREGDCSATAPARRRAKATMAVCVLVALSSQPQPFLPSALPPAASADHSASADHLHPRVRPSYQVPYKFPNFGYPAIDL